MDVMEGSRLEAAAPGCINNQRNEESRCSAALQRLQVSGPLEAAAAAEALNLQMSGR